MIFFKLLISLKIILLGAVYGRLDGGGIAKISEWVERSLIMFFFVLACAPFAGLHSLWAYAGVAGIATGHGQYFLKRSIKYTNPEFFDFFVRLFFGSDPRTKKDFEGYAENSSEILKAMEDYGLKKLYWRCAFGMFVTGTITGLPAFIVAAAFGKIFGLFFLLTGIVKAVSYIISWKIFKDTAQAEYLNGGGRNVLCLIVMYFSLIS